MLLCKDVDYRAAHLVHCKGSLKFVGSDLSGNLVLRNSDRVDPVSRKHRGSRLLRDRIKMTAKHKRLNPQPTSMFQAY
jgi:hypothetical protein